MSKIVAGIEQSAEPCWTGKLQRGHAFEYGDGAPHWQSKDDGSKFLTDLDPELAEIVELVREASPCWHVFCDGCGYRYDEDEYVTHFPNQAGALAVLGDVDWRIVGGRVLCPECPTGGDDE